jgi:hypothetical protein
MRRSSWPKVATRRSVQRSAKKADRGRLGGRSIKMKATTLGALKNTIDFEVTVQREGGSMAICPSATIRCRIFKRSRRRYLVKAANTLGPYAAAG